MLSCLMKTGLSCCEKSLIHWKSFLNLTMNSGLNSKKMICLKNSEKWSLRRSCESLNKRMNCWSCRRSWTKILNWRKSWSGCWKRMIQRRSCLMNEKSWRMSLSCYENSKMKMMKMTMNSGWNSKMKKS